MHPRRLLSFGFVALLGPVLILPARNRDIKPCELLTPAQVSTVLPQHDAGMVAANGESLIKGVKSYQCSYTTPAINLLTVIVTVAADDAAFGKIAPSESMHSDHRQIKVGDRGWVYGEDNDLKVSVVKGHALVDLELMATGARQKAHALVELARAVAQKV
ncbi:MAG TPA: hypothetical protein VGJ36_01045 [Gemmatimonadales bacterium]|jgi:hypothetical protein